MKKSLEFILCLSFFLLTLSCNEDEILDLENPNTRLSKNFWKIAEDAEAGIFSAYSALQFSGATGAVSVYTFALLSANGMVGNINRLADRIEIDNALVSSTNPNVLAIWQDVFRIVFRSNQVLKHVPKINMDASYKKEILGEAYFLRGLAMFWIASTFNKGEVPYQTTVPDDINTAFLALKDSKLVYDQILEDLKTAQSFLADRKVWEDDQKGRATWGAVTAILGKVYLYNEDFKNAKIEFKKVIDSGIYTLTPSIRDNFNEVGEFNSESIFEVQFYNNVDGVGNFSGGEGNFTNESSSRAISLSRVTGGFGLVFVSHYISAIFRNEVIDPRLPINQQMVTRYAKGYKSSNSDAQNAPFIYQRNRTLSVRAEASIAYEEDETLFYTESTATDFARVRSRAQIRKFSNSELVSEKISSPINERIIRLADVYLMYAESLLRDQGDAAISEALLYINKVRQRSGLVTLESLFLGVSMPPIILNTFRNISPAQQQDILSKLPSSFLIKQQSLTTNNILRHLFDKERPAEFAWEGRGICWHDLRRRPAAIGNAVQRINELARVNHEETTFDVQLFENEFPEDIDTFLKDFSVRKLNFNEEDYFFPIPAKELIHNPLINK